MQAADVGSIVNWNQVGEAFIMLLTLASIPAWEPACRWLSRGGWRTLPAPHAPLWGLADVALVILVWTGFWLLAGFLLSVAGGGPPPDTGIATAWELVVGSSVSLTATFFGYALIVSRAGGDGRALVGSLGLWRRWFLLGLWVYVLVFPAVSWLQIVLNEWVVYRHETLTSLAEHPTAAMILAAWFGAVLVAPVTEEFFFRGLIQGWLQRVESHAPWRQLLRGGPPPGATAAGAEKEAIGEVGAPIGMMERAEKAVGGWRTAPPGAEASNGLPRYPLSILGSAALFGLMHWGQGLAPIPLFCLGLALGYVYDRAGTILPCIVTHFLINATAMTLATLSALFP